MSVTAGAANSEKVEGEAVEGEEVEGEADRKRSKPDEAAELN